MIFRTAAFFALLSATSALAQAPDPASRGRLLALQCQACHSFKPGEAHGVGPNLAGIIGTAAASRPGFAGYSAALKASGLAWDTATLDKWLASPAKLVPGTKMAFGGVSTPTDRAAIIAYLAVATR